MGSFADHWEDKILDHIFGKAVYNCSGGTYPTVTIFVGLSTADPGDDALGLVEPSSEYGYARVETVPVDWTPALGGAIENAEVITFPEASGVWGLITHFALFDAAEGGNMLAHGSVTLEKTIASGDTVRLDEGDLVVSLD